MQSVPECIADNLR